MTTTILLFLLLFSWVVWFVFSPLIQSSKLDFNMILDNVDDSQKNLQLARSELMRTLKELDFDFEMGKLSKEDYQELKSKYEQETITVLKQIDAEKELWKKFQTKIDLRLGKRDV